MSKATPKVKKPAEEEKKLECVYEQSRYVMKSLSPTSSSYSDKRGSGLGAWSIGLNQQRLQGQLCDVILESDDGLQQHAHRGVLAASSEYFERMFLQAGFEESQKKVIQLHCVPGNSLLNILDFIYTGTMELTQHSVHTIVEACNYLSFHPGTTVCTHFMLHTLTAAPTEALKIAKTADRCGFEKLKNEAWAKICDNFDLFMDSKEFKELPLKEVVSFLSSDLGYVAEEAVWQAVVKWLEFDLKGRKRYLDQIMKCVRFALLPADTLYGVVKPHKLAQGSTCVKRLVDEAIQYKLMTSKQSSMQSPQTKPRGDLREGIYCLVGTKTFYVYMPIIKKWYALASPQPVELVTKDGKNLGLTLVAADGQLYAIGKLESGNELVKTKVVFSIQAYDRVLNEWKHVALPTYKDNAIFVGWKNSLVACSESAIEMLKHRNGSWQVSYKHAFEPYDFVCSGLGNLQFFSLASGTLTTIKNDLTVEVQTITRCHDMKLLDIAQLTRNTVLVTWKLNGVYKRGVYDTNKKVLAKQTEMALFWRKGIIPLCADKSKVWHVQGKLGLTERWIMMSHPAIMSTDRNGSFSSDNVTDSVFPFYKLCDGTWERLPSIPEQMGKPLSLCEGHNTTVACTC